MPVGNLDAVEEHVGQSHDIGYGLELPAGDGALEGGLVLEGLYLGIADMVDGRTEESSGTCSWV